MCTCSSKPISSQFLLTDVINLDGHLIHIHLVLQKILMVLWEGTIHHKVSHFSGLGANLGLDLDVVYQLKLESGKGALTVNEFVG